MKKNILITGDSRGLGKSIKKELEKHNFNLIGISRNSNDINYDLSNPDKIKELYFDEIKPKGPIYGLINNAAIAYDDIITNANSSLIEEMFKVNVISPIMLTKYAIRDMLLNKTQGSIVHISSISVHTGYKGLSMYASSKGAIEAFSKNAAREWGKFGIRSNVVCPGFMDTAMSSKLNDKQRDKIFKRNSFGKEIEVEDVAKTVQFLMSPNSIGITGQVIHVDNGTL
jgi:3-oxoacyl-[acyl-carrier protein] reductase|tara:strand:+ start:315 stop:995 length:681 start_codon:yes stop_codon:yes gene_type:complete